MYLYWPIILIVLSDVLYQICAKSTPEKLSPFASLSVTYLVGAVVSAILFFALSGGQNLFSELKKINLSTFLLGIAVIGLEAGSIYMYRVGWNVNTGNIVKSGILAVALILVGYFVYKEQITATKVIGAAVCLLGLFLINK